MLRVRAQPLLRILGRLLRVALETISATLVVDVAGSLAGLRLALLLRLGGLATGVGCGHDEVDLLGWMVSAGRKTVWRGQAYELVRFGWERWIGFCGMGLARFYLRDVYDA